MAKDELFDMLDVKSHLSQSHETWKQEIARSQSQVDVLVQIQHVPSAVITKFVMLCTKNQVLVQMQHVPSSVNALKFYANVQPNIRGRNVYVQFSSHQELTTMDQSQGRGDEALRLSSSINNVRVLLRQEVHFRDTIFMMVVVSWTFSSQINLFLTSYYQIVVDFIASCTGTSQTQISPQSRKANLHKYALLVLYLSIYESNMLIFVKSILIYILFLSSSVKQPGYGDVGNMYPAQGSRARVDMDDNEMLSF
ncbi:hypothetical protein JHK87_040249 [Glycine soja]|nr:hypothetical protein JHK87_040249 [Glycine soja]